MGTRPVDLDKQTNKEMKAIILAPEVESKFMQSASVYLSVSITMHSKQLLNISHVACMIPDTFHGHHIILAMTLYLR